MLQTVAKRSTLFAPRAVAAVTQRGLAIDGMKGYSDKERGEEIVYFKKEEEKLLRQLLAKVAQSASQHDVEGAKAAKAESEKALDSIIGSKLSPAEKEALLKWKNSH